MRLGLAPSLGVATLLCSTVAAAEPTVSATPAAPVAPAAAAVPPAGSQVGPLPVLAGFRDGFFVRDEHDNFRLYLRARLNLDFNAFFGPGVADVTAPDGGAALTP